MQARRGRHHRPRRRDRRRRARQRQEDRRGDRRDTGRMELDGAAIPAEPCLFTDDTTIERLGSRLAEHGGRFAVLSPEGPALLGTGCRCRTAALALRGRTRAAWRSGRRASAPRLDLSCGLIPLDGRSLTVMGNASERQPGQRLGSCGYHPV